MTRPPLNTPTPRGTRRRLRALMNRSWSPEAIETVTGIPATDIAAALRDHRETTRPFDYRVAGAYDLLWNRRPPQATARDRELAAAARDTAERCHWPPPMAWDDEVIDQLYGRPAAGWKRTDRISRRAADLDEDMAFVREQDGYRHAPLSAIAGRLGVSGDTLGQARRRTATRHADREAEGG